MENKVIEWKSKDWLSAYDNLYEEVYTNFEITPGNVERISKVEGVDVVLGAGRYTLRIWKGKLFEWKPIIEEVTSILMESPLHGI